MLCYVAVIWWTHTQLATVSKQLEHLQRLTCLYITGAKRTAPTAALKIIIGIPPLAVYIKQEAMVSCGIEGNERADLLAKQAQSFIAFYSTVTRYPDQSDTVENC